MATIEEKQKELDALQTDFDEYIVSARELEEELDAELTKCQDDVAKANSRNTALANQLANIQPQLNSLETKLSAITTQLSNETQRRISAEMKSEEAENKLRESEGTLASVRSSEVRKLKEENEDLCERLAFVEGEAEDYRNELNTEREQHREAMEEVKGDVNMLRMKLKEREQELELIKVDISATTGEDEKDDKQTEQEGDGDDDEEGKDVAEGSTPPPPTTTESEKTNNDREEYIRTLEDELELVTEQLIDAETKLSQTQAELEEVLVESEEMAKKKAEGNGVANGTTNNSDADVDANTNEHSDKITELESSIKLLQEENATLLDESKRLKEELELVLEELALSKEELDAYEEDRKDQAAQFDIERKQHKEELADLQNQLDKFSSEERSRDIESKSFEEALVASKMETQTLQEEVEKLEVALTNSKTDSETLQQEIDELKAAYDDTANRERAESEGQHQALEELLATRTREVDELKEELSNLSETNTSLTSMHKNMEDNIAKQQTDIEKQQKHVASASASSSQELQNAQDEIYSLEGLLETARKELNEQKDEVVKVRETLQKNIEHAKEELTTAEDELTKTKSKLLEVEKERLNNQPQSTIGDEDIKPKKADRLSMGNDELQTECDRLEDQNRMSISMKNHLEDEIKQLQKQLLEMSEGSNNNKENESVQDLSIIDDTNIEDILQSNDSDVIAKEVRVLAKKLSAVRSHNAELLTRILKLQGNIQVCCRIRPMSIDETQKGLHEVAQSLSETEVGCFDERTKSWKSYAFDKVWGHETEQKEVFGDVEPMVLSVVDGYNACIFAYGQTGSGKTWTMEGSKENGQYGISQRTIQKLFNLLQEKEHQHQQKMMKQDGSISRFEFKIEISMLEIYNDEVYDLLDSGFGTTDGTPRSKKSLDIRHGEDQTVEVPGLIKEKVDSVASVLAALDRGNLNRAKATTNLNEHSSRSHMILRVEVTSGVADEQHKGNLFLVDLAGSERVRKSEVEGKALKEAQHINKSLSALGNVMEALDRKASHVPYRDSKLTYLLQNSLGGNSRTMMVVTVCPHNNSYDETTFALKFATRVRRINLGSAQKNVGTKNLQETVKSLTSEMSLISKAKERSESQLTALKKEKERVEEKLSRASLSRKSNSEELRTLSVLRQTNNDITARWQKEKNIREEKTAELGKIQEELQKVNRDLRFFKREQESLSQQCEDKENTIFKLKKDLRSMKEQFNEEKIRHRRSQVMQSRSVQSSSRIPPPSTTTRGTRKSPYSSSLVRPSSRVKKTVESTTSPTDTKNGDDESNVARIRFRVLKLLQKHDPLKVEKIDTVMASFKGRETELLEKMINRYEKKDGGATTTPEATTTASLSSSNEDSSAAARPMSRQDQALARHLKRMERIRASGDKGR